jgi:hypothetical protein
MVVRFFDPFRTSARIRFSGIPHSPNPPIMMTGAVAHIANRLIRIGHNLIHSVRILNEIHHGAQSGEKQSPGKGTAGT